ncbi:MAG: hypothetical protein WBL25_10100, partial [Anaerolineales bacterium]
MRSAVPAMQMAYTKVRPRTVMHATLRVMHTVDNSARIVELVISPMVGAAQPSTTTILVSL